MAPMVSKLLGLLSLQCVSAAALVARATSNPLVVDLGYAQYQGVYNATSG